MSKIVGLIGFINSGKGTVASKLVEEHNFRQDSFASSLKDACAAIFGWPRHLIEGDTKESREWREIVDPWWSNKLDIPNFSPRYALQYMGTDVLRNHFNQDLWFNTVENRIRQNPDQNIVISDVRFPNEVNFIRGQGGLIARVSRGPEPVWYETATMANKGNTIATEVMTKTYSTIHFSEWAWVGTKVDFEINNNSSLDYLDSQIGDIINAISGQYKKSA